MSKEKQIDVIIDLLTEFDEMGFVPTTTVPNPEAYAIKWRDEMTKALIDYRKQSEGEWVVKNIFFAIYKCSICGAENLYKDGHACLSKFCSECGARMKGGAE